MRHYPLFVAAPFVALLAGCGPDTGNSAFNPATDVELPFTTFILENTETVDNLQHTRFDDFYRGIQPLDSDDADAAEVVGQLRGLVHSLMGAAPDDSGQGYDRVRNPLDLMNQVIAANVVPNFDEGRSYISDRIDEGKHATYNTRSNGAMIRFVDGSVLQEPLPVREWRYQTLAWTYTPYDEDGNAGYEKVSRVIQHIARQDDSADEDDLPQLVSFLAGTQFDANNFVTNGYNQPEMATVSFATRTLGSLELRQEFIGEKTDTLFISDTDSPWFTINGTTPDCVRAELDYPMQVLRLYTSTGESATIDHDNDPETPKEDNPAHCDIMKDIGDETLSFATVAVPARQ
ncbi:hypothetical protein [Marinobacter xestospongiae]|uniref:Lipoprotein n=1 Tax=Marinobacter xestospongiae TaxID=994319 RepID=A0ABU3VZ28_9GAMM|nr:hypothetical protein [Marinobacter xestospongiae]MDV2079511.1 hypothetical protein [Marinobacter xestospongiae]